MIQRCNSFLLDIEAADYFKLDPSQVHMLSGSSHRNSSLKSKRNSHLNTGKMVQARSHSLNSNNTPQEQHYKPSQSSRPTKQKRGHNSLKSYENQRKTNTIQYEKTGSAKARPTDDLNAIFIRDSYTTRKTPTYEPVSSTLVSFACSSTTSTNSLPSISSSPSVSPSLVCPHLSLDDILSSGNGSKSPHTIGLCARCRLDPPPNIQSPLSPAFRPSTSQITRSKMVDQNGKANSRGERPTMRRGYSDHQVSAHSERALNISRMQRLGLSSSSCQREDSLDYCLEPGDLKRLQMSPTLRHSVEFIRNNSIEAGRVLKIYKNGQPFDKALRVCVTRGEFASLNHLLDHINGRQLIPSGARYLFHLDGQLVYSVNELKHGSAYIVSGTRHFDHRANNLIKEQHKKELQVLQHQHQQVQSRRKVQQQQKGARPTASKNGLHNDWAPTTDKFLPLDSPRDNMHHNNQQRQPVPIIRRRSSLEDAKDSSSKNTDEFKVREATRARMSSRQPRYRQQVVAKNAPKAKAISRKRSPSQLDRQLMSPQTSSEKPRQTTSEVDLTSKSNENVDYDGKASEESPVKVMRAKSELSALPNKRKKNVTFVDTGRGASPVATSSEQIVNTKPVANLSSIRTSHSDENNSIKLVEEPKQTTIVDSNIKALNTNEIGIQVSDSIEGFLIDLPLPLPPKGDDAKRPFLRSQGSRVGQRGARINLDSNNNQAKRVANQTKPKRQVVTITERQLSLDEMDMFKDLDHGDHHSESRKVQRVKIKLDSLDTANSETTIDEADESTMDNKEVVPDRAKTTAIGNDSNELNRASDVSITDETKNNDTDKDLVKGERTHWQYPGGRETSTTPTERPVSQSEANESVHARVTTPTPSLSTAGDNNSLSMSYDAPVGGSALKESSSKRAITQKIELPAKQRAPVMGKLCRGINPPSKNLRLTWVNGFTINDQYPENSTILFTQSSANKNSGGQDKSLLSPGHELKDPLHNQFKPSERFHNWICHSRRHDELIYPAGSLVVLWCRLTNEQRYYSKHTSNVSSIALASLDDDIMASAQIGDLRERINPCVHLWSLTSLETLLIVDDDQFRSRRIFSLKVRNTKSEGCEMTVGAKDDKHRLWLYVFNLKLNKAKDEQDIDSGQVSAAKSTKKPISTNQPVSVVIKADKVLQTNQMALLVTRTSNVRGKQPTDSVPLKHSQLNDMILSFGRRHFQIWLTDWKKQKLHMMQPENTKSPGLRELIVRANCLVRMSPTEFLVGDSDGNITLLVINCHSFPSPPKSPVRSSPKYSVDTLPLLSASGIAGQQAQPTTTANGSAGPMGARLPSITCLARISGSLFASGDSTCTVRFWKIDRPKSPKISTSEIEKSAKTNSSATANNLVTCRQLSCINLPRDLGFICTFILSKFSRKQSMIEFYVVSTSNAILFGSVRLQIDPNDTIESKDILANSSLSVVYEGHETSVMNLVADSLPLKARGRRPTSVEGDGEQNDYFTCSLDCRICKWSGKKLIWKSMLPSACASLAVHSNGFVLAVGSADGTVYILDKISGLLISYFPLTPVCINCLAYSRDGALLAAGCANGSIFILPVSERGLKYKKVSIFQSPYPVVSLQFSADNQYILTSVTHGSYQELILWDLPNFRYMRDNVKMAADKIEWFDSICSGSEDVRAIWENANLASTQNELVPKSNLTSRRLSSASTSSFTDSTTTVVNLSCHRLIRSNQQPGKESFAMASDTHGYLRLFRYPCYDIQQSFYEIRVSSSAVNCCRFLAPKDKTADEAMLVSSSLDGSICLWTLE